MPTDWEFRYQNQDVPWDHGEASPPLMDFLQTHPVQGRVLVPGCGFGYDVRAIGQAGGGKADVLGLDLAPSAIQGARVLSACDISGGRYELGNFLALPEQYRGSFDWVWEHTLFCAIDPDMRLQYVESVAAALKPGGRFLAVFYLNPEVEPGQSGPPFGVTPRELDTYFERRFELMRDWTPTRTYPGREGRERMRFYVKSRSG